MKRLLLNSSNIKPVNIRIVSNGVECADLRMLKENFCISDIKNVLDGRLVNWLSNIGEKELANCINEKYSSPDSLNGKEYYLCELFFKDILLKDYIQILFKEKEDALFLEEIKRISNIIIEAYNLFQYKYTSKQWLDLFELDSTLYDRKKYHTVISSIKQQVSKEKYNSNNLTYFAEYLNAVYKLAENFPQKAQTQARIIFNSRYKDRLDPETERLCKEFINNHLQDYVWTDKIRMKGKIDGFLNIHQLKNINYEHN